MALFRNSRNGAFLDPARNRVTIRLNLTDGMYLPISSKAVGNLLDFHYTITVIAHTLASAAQSPNIHQFRERMVPKAPSVDWEIVSGRVESHRARA